MSFFGKKYKSVATENMTEVFAAMKVDEKTSRLLEGPDAVTCFTRNADGSVLQTIEVAGKKVYENTVVLDKESQRTTPDGKVLRSLATLVGDTLRISITSERGTNVVMTRVFQGDSFVMTIQPEGSDIKGQVTYKQV